MRLLQKFLKKKNVPIFHLWFVLFQVSTYKMYLLYHAETAVNKLNISTKIVEIKYFMFLFTSSWPIKKPASIQIICNRYHSNSQYNVKSVNS